MADPMNPLSLFRPRQPTLGDQVAALGNELSDLANAVRKYATPRMHGAAEGAADYAAELGRQLEPVARDIAHRARRTAIAVRKDPAPAIVAIATLTLIAMLFTRRQ
jgi:hypothetical protein